MGLLYDIAKSFFGGSKSPLSPEAAKDVGLVDKAARMVKNDAITLKAKEAVNMYPVLISEDVMVMDENLVFAINGYLEQQYAIFTMLATGLTPVLGEDTAVRNYLGKFYTHENENLDDLTDTLIRDVSNKSEDETGVDKDYVFVEDGIPGVTDKVDPKIGLSSKEMEEKGFFSREADRKGANDFREKEVILNDIKVAEGLKKKLNEKYERLRCERNMLTRPADNNRYASIDKEMINIMEKVADIDKEIGTLQGELENNDKVGGLHYTKAQIEAIAEKSKATDPTIVRVRFQVPNLNETVEIPIAVKTMVHPLSTEECTQIFTYLKEDKAITTIVRLFSGEIKFFKDIIFQLDRAKKDKDLYNKLGRHPWFRQLIHRKQNKRARNLASIIPKVEELVKGKPSDTLPIATLIVTKNEIERGYSNTIANIIHQKDKIMNNMMLLAIGIVDDLKSEVTFLFYGLNDPCRIKFGVLTSEFKTGSKGDKEKDAESLMKNLFKLM